jgi:NAD(P)-dependent dehydrogenase (short-subunit alcohol dehydrogenase family)/uncharacterized ubiquitin-like protein YukD
MTMGSEGIKSFVLNLVSEKTGYPQEMLDLDLDLEADLGIDTVKQAELFAAVRTNYGIPRREDLRLSDYNTLTKVIGFVSSSLEAMTGGGSASAVQPAVAQPAPASPTNPTVVDSQPTSHATDGDQEAIKGFVLNLVSEKTGYPQEMLDLDLDLEADLGIDTVKQAELFAAVRTNYGIPRREDLRLSDYNTLNKVIGFVTDALSLLKKVESEPVPAQPETDMGGAQTIKVAADKELIEYPRRVPALVLRPRLDLCQPSGVVLDANSRIIVAAGQGKTGEALARKLRSRKAQVVVVNTAQAQEMIKKVTAFVADGLVQGIYFLPALDVEPGLSEMDVDQYQVELDRRALSFYALIKAIPGEPFVFSATRMGGLHGFDPQGAVAPMGGAVGGLTKSLGLERSGTFVKVVDFEETASDNFISTRLIAETLSDPAVVEVGWYQDLRFTVTLEVRSAGTEGVELAPGSVFVISGGSGGITGPIAVDLAQATGGTFYLLSRTSLPVKEDADLARLKSDRNGLKADMMRRLSEKGEKATPAVVEQKIAALERAAQTLETIVSMEAAGAKVCYIPCDIVDSASVEEAIKRIAQEAGRVDVFIHSAGVERSRKIETKSEDEFKQTIKVKAVGFHNLITAMARSGMLPKSVALFSSVAGRFGNTGQTDYSAANDYLAKLASSLGRQFAGVRAVTIDWGAWAEVGMASRGFIPELMKRAGIEMMEPRSAAVLVRRELCHPGSEREVVLAGSLGVLLEAHDANGGLDMEKANIALTEGKPIHTMLTRVSGMNLHEGVILEAELDPEQEPFLRDHAMNGVPLLPGVMGIEGLSTAARHVSSVLASEKGSFQVAKIEDVHFLAPFKFYRGQKRVVTWKANVYRQEDGLVARVILESSVSRFGRDPETMLHFTGRVYLTADPQPISAEAETRPHWNGSRTLDAEDIYKLYFHGPAFQVLEGVQRKGDLVLGKLRENLPAITAQEHGLATAPLLVELCLQTAGVWEIGTTGSLALPSRIGSLKLYHVEAPSDQLFAEVKPLNSQDGALVFDARVIDQAGKVYLELENYSTQSLPYTMENHLLAPVIDWLKDQE